MGPIHSPLKTQPNCKKCYNFLIKKEDWISPAFQKYVSIIFAQNLLKRVRKPDILLLRPLWAPLGVLSGTKEISISSY